MRKEDQSHWDLMNKSFVSNMALTHRLSEVESKDPKRRTFTGETTTRYFSFRPHDEDEQRLYQNIIMNNRMEFLKTSTICIEFKGDYMFPDFVNLFQVTPYRNANGRRRNFITALRYTTEDRGRVITQSYHLDIKEGKKLGKLRSPNLLGEPRLRDLKEWEEILSGLDSSNPVSIRRGNLEEMRSTAAVPHLDEASTQSTIPTADEGSGLAKTEKVSVPDPAHFSQEMQHTPGNVTQSPGQVDDEDKAVQDRRPDPSETENTQPVDFKEVAEAAASLLEDDYTRRVFAGVDTHKFSIGGMKEQVLHHRSVLMIRVVNKPRELNSGPSETKRKGLAF